MRLAGKIKRLFGNLAGRGRLEVTLDAELRGYLDEMTERKIRQGIPPIEAKRQALLEAGGLDQVNEQVRDTWLGTGFARHFFGDENPVGRRVGTKEGVYQWEIIGVVKNSKYTGLREGPIRMIYVPMRPARSTEHESRCLDEKTVFLHAWDRISQAFIFNGL